MEEKYEIENGKNIQFTVQCNFVQPLYGKWFKNGKPIDMTITEKRLIFSSKNGIYELRIEKCDNNIDTGFYTFAVKDYKTNSFISSNGFLIVRGNNYLLLLNIEKNNQSIPKLLK